MNKYEEAFDAVEKYGTKAEAARQLGISRSTLRDRLEKTSDEKKSSERDLKQELREKERIIERQADQLEKLRDSKWKIPKQKKVAPPKGSFIRFIIPDTHGSMADEQAMGAMLADLEKLNPREIVLIGDHLECGGFLAQHHTLGYIAQTQYTFEEDVDATNTFLDKVQEIAPNASIHYLEGNHENRIERWVIDQTLRNEKDAKFLYNLVGPESVLHLKERGIPYYRLGEFHGDCRVPGTVKFGNCYFSHTHKTAKHAAAKNLASFGACLVFGHTHRIQSHVERTVKDGVLGAWSVGCLCQLQPVWRNTDITDWAHGYGFQIVSGDDFRMNTIPIIEGKSLLYSASKEGLV